MKNITPSQEGEIPGFVPKPNNNSVRHESSQLRQGCLRTFALGTRRVEDSAVQSLIAFCKRFRAQKNDYTLRTFGYKGNVVNLTRQKVAVNLQT